VRQLAKQLTLNPATVAKALQALVGEGILQVRRGEGTFVAPHPPRLNPEARQQVLVQKASPYAAAAKSLGAELAEAQKALETAWQSLEEATR
jgi:GntR family transcriptional regulator